jgi:hypothetical protein
VGDGLIGGIAGLESTAARTTTLHEPTSIVLDRLIRDAPAKETTLAWIVDRLDRRSFGLMMLVLGILGLLPGIVTVAALVLLFPAIEMLLGRERPSFPRAISRRRIDTARFARVVNRIQPILRRLERLVHPRRIDRFGRMKRVVGFAVLLLALTMLSPVPIAHMVPASAVVLISFAYLEEDGLLLTLGLVAAGLSLATTGATIWGAVAATDFLDRFL